jgi:hypothetical protein
MPNPTVSGDCGKRGKMPVVTFERWARYSGFASSAYRIDAAEWLFPQEKATLHTLSMSTYEAKPL